MLRKFGIALLIMVMVFLGISPLFAVAAGGTGPDDAVELTGTQSGSLDPGKDFWYRFSDAGTNTPLGVVLNFSPPEVDTTATAIPEVSFEVRTNVCSGGVCALTKIGLGSMDKLPTDTRYWQGKSPLAQTYFLRVYNNSTAPVDYAIAFTGATFPPPRLVISPSGAPAPTPVPTTAPPAPTPSTGGGKDAASATPLTQVQSGVLGSESVWFTFSPGPGDGAAIIMNFTPTTPQEQFNELVSFRVWENICPTGGMCTLTKVGQGTRSGLNVGREYWRTAGSNTTFFIEVFNSTGQNVGFAIAPTGLTFPPGDLTVPQP